MRVLRLVSRLENKLKEFMRSKLMELKKRDTWL